MMFNLRASLAGRKPNRLKYSQHHASTTPHATGISRLKQSLVGVGLCASLLTSSCTSLPQNNVAASPNNKPTGPVIALVLGGGGTKGFAHVGVIKVLEDNNIRPNLVVGTSSGSFVGSIYASGKSATELESLALNIKDSELTDFTASYQGIIEGTKLRNFVNKQVNQQPIEDFPIRFGAVAAEKHSLKKVVFTEGEAGLVVQASSSVPNIFIAPRIPDPKISGQIGKKYIDGGVVSMVPVDAARSLGADVVIAVDLQAGVTKPLTESESEFKSLPSYKNIWLLIEQGYRDYMTASSQHHTTGTDTQDYAATTEAEINRANVVIRPNVTNISSINSLSRKQAIAAGEAAAKQSLPAINDAIEHAHLN